MASRTFYVLYIPDGPIADCVDAIRVLANPVEKHRAHITVRGPYSRAVKRLDSINRHIESSPIDIHEAGNFFESGQNTVYLACTSPKLETVWDKQDYGFNPHITLYDGSSREFASKLWSVVSSHTYRMSFVAGPLKALVSSKRGQGGMALRADLDLRLLREVAGINMQGATVESLGEEERLNAIAKLCDYLSTMESDTALRHSDEPAPGEFGYEITKVDIASDILSQIKSLAKKNSATLGFLPDGAFDAYAQRGWIMAAIDQGTLLGYVIYRISRMRAVLVHLCTDEKRRGGGIAKQLFLSVVGRTSELRGILANSRRDFPAHNMWPRLGFAAIGEKPGRGTRPSVLTRWWYEHPHPTLFSTHAGSLEAQSPIDVAIDLNVFYDIMMPSSGEHTEESLSLQSDWLIDEIQLCATGELFNEINRIDDSKARQGHRDLAHEFKRISGSADAFGKTYSLMASIMGPPKTERQSSNLRHLAHAAAADVEFFVTQEPEILRFQRKLEAVAGLTAMRPGDLVIELDQVRNTASYQPVRLRGTSLEVAKVTRQKREELEDIFVNRTLGEQKAEFRRRFSAILPSRPDVSSSVVLAHGQPIALYGMDRSDPDVLSVPCFRIQRGRLARTLARQIVSMAIEASIANDCPITAVTDDWLDPFAEEALAEAGFVKNGVRWLKLNFSAVGTQDSVSVRLDPLLKKLEASGIEFPGKTRMPLNSGSRLSAAETIQIEKVLRPLKLTNAALDTLVIPVRPGWAQHLFDTNLADQTLFGARPDLILRWEDAYYRAPRSLGNIVAPFRILWYVSQDRRYTGTRQIRAYSVGSSVEVLSAHVAHDRYKRLGVYDREQVLEIAGGDPNGPVMVIRFCDTEAFKNPIDGARFRELLETSDQKKPSLRGPQRISEAAFAAIYSEGQSC